MKGKIQDENFYRNETAEESSVVWFELPCDKFEIYGVTPEENGILSRRMPLDVAYTVSGDVASMCGYGAGGRVLFSTDSAFVAVKAEYKNGGVPTVCNYCVCYGFDLYKSDENGQESFVGACRPVNEFDHKNAEYKVDTNNMGEMTYYTLNMPVFSEVKKLWIGLEKGSQLGKGKDYRNHKPVVFYGSSITHGAAAGRPGNIYENFISQKYNLDYINLGFSGSARGEETMARYISSLDMSVFVCDYDYNAPDAEHLRKTHFPFYEIIREKHPDIPYIMISRPNFSPYNDDNERRKVIFESFEKAKLNDKNVYFIDGETLFDGEFKNSCTSDGVHPNDLGFYRMADKIGTVIAQVLAINL